MVGLHAGVASLYHPVVHGLVEEGASEEQVKDAEHILREEMSRKIIWLLADVLDQPGRLLDGLQMLMEVAQSIHGYKTENIRQKFIEPSSTMNDAPNLSIKGQSLRASQSNPDSSIAAEDAGRPKQNLESKTCQTEPDLQGRLSAQVGNEKDGTLLARFMERVNHSADNDLSNGSSRVK